MHHHEQCEHKGFVKWFLSWKGVAATLALAGVSYYLLTEHKEHLAVALPYLILLACPLMHIFHGHHGGHGNHHKDQEKE